MDLVGMVTSDGKAIPGALVELMHPDGELFEVMYTTSDGRFRFSVHIGEWLVGVTCGGVRRSKEVSLGGELPTAYVHFDLTTAS